MQQFWAEFANAGPDAQTVGDGAGKWPIYTANISTPVAKGTEGKFMFFGKKTPKSAADYAGVDQRLDDVECGFWRSIDEGAIHYQ